MHFGVIEYELMALIVVSIINVILTIIDYFYINKKRYRDDLILSVIRKLIVIIVCLIADLFTHINDKALFTNVNYITESVTMGVTLIILASLYFEIKSALEKFSNITGIDVDKIPFINTNLDKINEELGNDELKKPKK